MEQYSHGHLEMMQRIKDLQRRLDLTLGKPSSLSKSKKNKPINLALRLSRLESQNMYVNEKIEDIFNVLGLLVKQEQNIAHEGF